MLAAVVRAAARGALGGALGGVPGCVPRVAAATAPSAPLAAVGMPLVRAAAAVPRATDAAPLGRRVRGGARVAVAAVAPPPPPPPTPPSSPSSSSSPSPPPSSSSSPPSIPPPPPVSPSPSPPSPLHPALVGRLHARLGIRALSPVQVAAYDAIATALPRSPAAAPAHAHDVAITAETGSGKTLAYLLPLLASLEGVPLANAKLRHIIVAPTRELALQVAGVATRLTAAAAKKRDAGTTGGGGVRVARLVGEVTQQALAALRTSPPHLLVGTPRALAAVIPAALNCGEVAALVLDEADELVRNHHIGAVRALTRTVLAFKHRPALVTVSATSSHGLVAFHGAHARGGARLRAVDLLGAAMRVPATIDHYALRVANAAGAYAALTRLLAAARPSGVLVFCNSAATLEAVEVYLRRKNIPVSVLGAAYAGAERAKSLAAAASGASLVLLATEMAARGLDIPRLSHVVNFDLPASAREYVHRAGRVGRLSSTTPGHAGTVVSFVIDAAARQPPAPGTLAPRTDAAHLTAIAAAVRFNLHEVSVAGGEWRVSAEPLHRAA